MIYIASKSENQGTLRLGRLEAEKSKWN